MQVAQQLESIPLQPSKQVAKLDQLVLQAAAMVVANPHGKHVDRLMTAIANVSCTTET